MLTKNGTHARFDELASALLEPFVLPDEKKISAKDYLGSVDPCEAIFGLVVFVRRDNALFFLDHDDLAGKFADGTLPRSLYPHFRLILHHADSFCRFQLGGFALLRRYHERLDFPEEIYPSLKRRVEDRPAHHCAGETPGVLR